MLTPINLSEEFVTVSTMVDSPTLQADAVDFVRNHNPILSGVSLTVRAGEHWALLGPNGAGKTTLLKMLGALEHPTRGSVHVLGHRLGRVDMRELRTAIGHVDPRHNPPYPLTAHEVVLTGLTSTPDIKQRWSSTPEQDAEADRLLELMGLTTLRTARWPTLSQGERGRALIARALIAEPRLLLLDEPATGLDVGGREQLIDRLDALQATHPELASVLVTHHLEELPPATTHALLLRDGRAVASGPVDEVLTGDTISTCFDHPIRLDRTDDGRWQVRAVRSVYA